MRTELIRRESFAGFDEDGGSPGEHRSERQRAIRQSERSERSNQTQNQVMGFRSRPLIQTIR
jgi:hypothetical protein